MSKSKVKSHFSHKFFFAAFSTDSKSASKSAILGVILALSLPALNLLSEKRRIERLGGSLNAFRRRHLLIKAEAIGTLSLELFY
jgi:hypothetical protein